LTRLEHETAPAAQRAKGGAAMNVERIAARFHVGALESARAHIGSGAWLVATAAYHPWPVDRLTAAQQHFRAALGGGDDFSAWLGIALSQAALRGGFLKSRDHVDLLGQFQVYYHKSFAIPLSEREVVIDGLRSAGADAAALQRVRELWRE
jgi:hypothetical protein